MNSHYCRLQPSWEPLVLPISLAALCFLFAPSQSAAAPLDTGPDVFWLSPHVVNEFVDNERFGGSPAQLDSVIDEFVRESIKSGAQTPVFANRKQKITWFLKARFGAQLLLPAEKGSYVVYTIGDRWLFFGPTDDPVQFSKSYASLASLLPRLRERSPVFGEAAVFPVISQQVGDIEQWLKNPAKLFRDSIRPDWVFLDRLSQIEALRQSAAPVTREDVAHLTSLLEVMQSREAGVPFEPDFELPRIGNRIISRSDAEALRLILAQELIRSEDDNFDAQKFAIDRFEKKFDWLQDTVAKILTREKVPAPLRDWTERGIAACKDTAAREDAAEAARAALRRVGQCWLLHRSMLAKRSPYELAIGPLNQDELDAIAKDLSNANRFSLSKIVGEQPREFVPPPRISLAPQRIATSQLTAAVVERLVADLPRRQTSTPVENPSEAGTDLGIVAVEQFLKARADRKPTIDLVPEGVRRLADDGASAREWRELGRVLVVAFGPEVAGEIVERAGAALVHDAVGPETVRSTYAQFAALQHKLEHAMSFESVEVKQGINLHEIVHHGGNQLGRKAVANLVATVVRKELLAAAGVTTHESDDRGLTPTQVSQVLKRAEELKIPLPSALEAELRRGQNDGLDKNTAKQVLDSISAAATWQWAQQAANDLMDRALQLVDPTTAKGLAEAVERINQTAREQFDLRPSNAQVKSPSDLKAYVERLAKEGANHLLDSNAPTGITGDVAREWLDQAPALSKAKDAAPNHTSPVQGTSADNQVPSDKWSRESNASVASGDKTGTGTTEGEAGQTGSKEASAQKDGAADGKGDKPGGKEGSKKEDSDSKGKSGNGDGAGGGILPGDMPLFRAIFQNLARYLGIEQLARKLLEVVYMLKPELFTAVTDALSKLHSTLVSEEVKAVFNDVNKVMNILGPLLGDLDAAIDKLAEEGVGKLVEDLAQKGLDRLTEEGLKKLSAETGIPLDLLQDLKNLPKGFDTKVALNKLKDAAKKQAWKAVESKLTELGVPADVVAAFREGDTKAAADRIIDAAKQKAVEFAEQKLNLPPGVAKAMIEGRDGWKKAAELVRQTITNKIAEQLKVDPAKLDALVGDDPQQALDSLVQIGGDRLKREVVERLGLPPEAAQLPPDKWLPAAAQQVAAQQLQRGGLNPEAATAISRAIVEGRPEEAAKLFAGQVRQAGENWAREQGLDPALLAALRDGKHSEVAERLQKLTPLALERLGAAKVLPPEVIKAVVTAKTPAEAAEALQKTMRQKLDDQLKHLKLENVLKNGVINPERAQAWIREHGREALQKELDRLGQLKEVSINDLQKGALATAEKLGAIQAGRLEAVYDDVERAVDLLPGAAKALAENNIEQVVGNVRDKFVREGAGEIAKLAGLSETAADARDLNTILNRVQDVAQKRIADKLSAQAPVFRGLSELAARAGDPQAVETWVKEHLTAALGTAAVEVGRQTELIRLLTASQWQEALGKLQALDETALRQLIEQRLLSAETLQIRANQNPTEALQQLEANFRAHLARQLANHAELGLPATLIDHFQRGDLQRLQSSLADWQTKVPERTLGTQADATQVITDLWRGKLDSAAQALDRAALAKTKDLLGLPANHPGNWDEIRREQATTTKAIFDSGTAAALDITPDRLTDFVGGKLDKVGELEFLTALQTWIVRDGCAQVAAQLKVDSAALARLAQNAWGELTVSSLEHAKEMAKSQAHDQIKEVLQRANIEEWRVRHRLGNHATKAVPPHP